MIHKKDTLYAQKEQALLSVSHDYVLEDVSPLTQKASSVLNIWLDERTAL